MTPSCHAEAVEVGLPSLRRSAVSATLEEVPLRCLIVDDSEDFLASASRLLISQGVDVVGCASGGAEARTLGATLRPDVALVDVQLGEEDGFELTGWLAENVHTTQVILVSTHEESDLLELIAESDAVGFLPKAAISARAIAELLV
jgi:DNA-binding NarL/FixJ family response regulator